MRIRVLFLVGGVTLLALLVSALRSGSGSPTASAVGAVQEGPATVSLVSTSESFKVTSKATFDANRVVIAIGTASPDPKVQSATFVCESTGESKPGAPKGREPGANPGTSLPDHELWSATFETKCITPGGSVNVRLTAVAPANKIVIKEARVQNTTTLVPQVGEINVTRISRIPQAWRISFKDQHKGFNRIDLEIGAPHNQRQVLLALFFCQNPLRIVLGEFKGRLGNVNTDPNLPDHEIWSGTFRGKCAGDVFVLLIPRHPRTLLVVKDGHAINTTHMVPIEGPANTVIKSHARTFKIGSGAGFPANRVEVDVATSSAQGRLVAYASFVCELGNKVTVTTPKRFDRDVNLPPGPPDHEVWSADFPTKCIQPGGSLTVTLASLDPAKQIVVKGARVQNTSKPPATPTPTPTATPTPAGTQGTCVAVGQNVPVVHRPDQPFWDKWKCTPSVQGLDWNRVDIYVGVPIGETAKKLKAVQFDCQFPGNSKAGAIANKAHFDTATQGIELWSGEHFVDANGVEKNCQGGVTILLAVVDDDNDPATPPTNHPPIKKATFSHTGLPKPTPTPKPVTNGSCQVANTSGVSGIAGFPWQCTPDTTVTQFNRIDIGVGLPTFEANVVHGAQFICHLTGEKQPGFPKGRKPNDRAGAVSPFHEIWSANFVQPCVGPVDVLLIPSTAASLPVIKKVTFSLLIAGG